VRNIRPASRIGTSPLAELIAPPGITVFADKGNHPMCYGFVICLGENGPKGGLKPRHQREAARAGRADDREAEVLEFGLRVAHLPFQPCEEAVHQEASRLPPIPAGA